MGAEGRVWRLCGCGRGLASRVGRDPDAGGTPALPVLVPAPYQGTGQALRGDDGWWAGMTIPVYQAAPGVVF